MTYRWILTTSCALLSAAWLVNASAADLTPVLSKTTTKGGLVVHVGAGPATADLTKMEHVLVQGLVTETTKLNAARKAAPVASFSTWKGPKLPYIDNFVNLLIVEAKVDQTEIMRVLTPGGEAFVFNGGAWQTMSKPRPQNIDHWRHFLHGPDNNPVARDQVVAPPNHLQWICGPAWSKHHEIYPPTVPVLVSGGGRTFYIEDRTPPAVYNIASDWWLVARDAFNGVKLWERCLAEWNPKLWPGDLGRWSSGPKDYRHRLVAGDDTVFIAMKGVVVAFDAASGAKRTTFGKGASSSIEIKLKGNNLFVANGETGARSSIACYNATSGAEKWRSPGGDGIAVSDDRVYFIHANQVGALDANSGKQLWFVTTLPETAAQPKGNERGRNRSGRLTGPLRAGEGVVLLSDGRKESVVALDGATGKRLWSTQNVAFRPWFRPVDAYIIHGLIWVNGQGKSDGDIKEWYYALGLDPKTGKVKKRIPNGQVWNSGHHGRCYPSKGTERFMIYSRRGSDFLELDTGKVDFNNWVRGTCTYGVVPANGMMVAAPHSCRCYSEAMVRGIQALTPHRILPKDSTDPLQKGPAYAQGPALSASANSQSSWPTYRHDPFRSGSTDAAASANPTVKWTANVGAKSSSPTLAHGLAFVADTEGHRVVALSLADGKERWSYVAGARVDTPPTICGRLALFGSTDGWIYCVTAETGELVWRFRASPADQRLGVRGQVESVWPVHGAVLVKDDIAYAAAGRSSFLDGGIRVVGLEVATGRLIGEQTLQGPEDNAGQTREHPNRGFVMKGSLPDILSTDGRNIFMRHIIMDLRLTKATDASPNLWTVDKEHWKGEEFGGDHKFWCDIREAPRLALKSNPEWYHRSYFCNFPGLRLYSTTGMLDDSWHIRSYWSYGQIVGQQLVFRGNRGYAVQAYPNAARWLNYRAGTGYVLYAGDTSQPKNNERLYALKPNERAWETKLPLRPQSMALAGDKLIVAGVPDAEDAQEALNGIQGKRGGLLHIVNTTDGKTVHEIKLPNAPTFDGIAVIDGKIVIGTRDGKVLCLE